MNYKNTHNKAPDKIASQMFFNKLTKHSIEISFIHSNSVQFDSVSKILEHKNLHMTLHYSKILDMKASDDMKASKEKFGDGNQMM